MRSGRLVKPSQRISGLAAICFIAAGFGLSVVAQESLPTVATVQLKEVVTFTDSQVKLGDVATITDQDPVRRKALAELDLATFQADRDLTIDRSFVEIRILLAGHDAGRVLVKGPEKITILAPPEFALNDLGVEQAVFEALTRQFSIPPEDLRVKLVSPFISSGIPGLESLKHPRLELMPTPQLPLGRVQLTVRVLDQSRVVVARPVAFEVSRRQQVVVATSSLDRANIVTADHIREESRFVDGPIDRLTASQVIGRKVIMPFRPEEVITLRHLGQPAEEESPVLVQPRDAVRLIAKKKNLLVTIPVAEALQAGRKGQLIRVRNVQSNQVVTGVVVARGEVHVILP
ncbi:flagellar basal body P-ring formation chaperone FlgA [Planctomicrobium sp. SH661]|uniref:flagellar basal body P-ring formation chaperone FlgA n=1 Tax=Planctomicrobium sp. SH661 TaxID=3448124 RepID=UPI003F5B07FB